MDAEPLRTTMVAAASGTTDDALGSGSAASASAAASFASATAGVAAGAAYGLDRPRSATRPRPATSVSAANARASARTIVRVARGTGRSARRLGAVSRMVVRLLKVSLGATHRRRSSRRDLHTRRSLRLRRSLQPDEDHAVRAAGAVGGERAGVLEHLDRLHVARVEVGHDGGAHHRDAVDDVERLTVGVEGAVAADAH